MILNLSVGVTSLLLKLMKLLGNHLQEKQQNPSLQRFGKVNKIRKRHGTVVLNCRCAQINLRMLYSLWSGKSMGNVMTNPRAIWTCTWLHLEKVHVHYSSSIRFYRMGPDFIWIEEEVHQWSDTWLKYDWSPMLYSDEESEKNTTRNHLSENNGIRRHGMEIDKSIVRTSGTDNNGQSLRLLRFNTLSGWSSNPSTTNEARKKKLNGAGRTTSSGIWMVSMVNRQNFCGEFSQDPRC